MKEKKKGTDKKPEPEVQTARSLSDDELDQVSGGAPAMMMGGATSLIKTIQGH